MHREARTKKRNPSPSSHHPSKKLFFIENTFRDRSIHEASRSQRVERGIMPSSSCTKFSGDPTFLAKHTDLAQERSTSARKRLKLERWGRHRRPNRAMN